MLIGCAGGPTMLIISVIAPAAAPPPKEAAQLKKSLRLETVHTSQDEGDGAVVIYSEAVEVVATAVEANLGDDP